MHTKCQAKEVRTLDQADADPDLGSINPSTLLLACSCSGRHLQQMAQQWRAHLEVFGEGGGQSTPDAVCVQLQGQPQLLHQPAGPLHAQLPQSACGPCISATFGAPPKACGRLGVRYRVSVCDLAVIPRQSGCHWDSRRQLWEHLGKVQPVYMMLLAAQHAQGELNSVAYLPALSSSKPTEQISELGIGILGLKPSSS